MGVGRIGSIGLAVLACSASVLVATGAPALARGGPSRPHGLSVPCFLRCSAPAVTRVAGGEFSPLALTAQSDAAAGEVLHDDFAVYAAGGDVPVATAQATAVAGEVATADVYSALADGRYSYRVRATDAEGTSPWSAPFAFVVDTVAPAAPTADAATLAETFEVGHPGTVHLDPGSGGTVGYLFGWRDLPVLDVHTCPTTPQPAGAGVLLVCPARPGGGVTLTPTAPPSPFATFSVETFDLAGNIARYSFQPASFADPGGDTFAHYWDTHRCPDGPGVGDSGSVGGDPLVAGAGRSAPACVRIGSSQTAVQPDPVGHALVFTAAQRTREEARGADLGDQGYTVGGWVMPTTTTRAAQVFLGQQPAAGRPGISLGLDADRHWQLAMADASGAVRSVRGEQVVDPGSWHFVAGVWDPGNDREELWVDRELVASGPVEPPATNPAGALVEGHGYGPDGRPDAWADVRIADAFVSDATMDDQQLSQAQFDTVSPPSP